MSLGLKYTTTVDEANDYLYASNDRYTLEVWEEGVVDDVQTIKIQQLSLNYTALTPSKEAPYIATDLSVTYTIEDTQIFDFLEGDERSIKGILKKNGAIVWQGFLLPDISSRPHLPLPYTVTLTFTEGVGKLKDVEYPVNGVRSMLQIINDCLLNTGLVLEYNIGVNLYDTLMNTSNEPFSQIDLNTEVFLNENGQVKNCYDVLMAILRRFTCRLMLKDNRWDIDRIDEIKNVTRTKRIMNTSLSFVSDNSSWTANDISTGLIFIKDSQSIRNIRGFRQIVIVTNYGPGSNGLSNGGFENWSSPTNADDWLESGGIDRSNDAIAGSFSARITTPPAPSPTVSTLINSSVVNITEDFDFSFQWKQFNPEFAGNNSMIFKIKVGVNWLQDLGPSFNWSTTDTKLKINLGGFDWKTLSLIALSPPASGDFTIEFFMGENLIDTNVNEWYTFVDNVIISQQSISVANGVRRWIRNDMGFYGTSPKEQEFDFGEADLSDQEGALLIGGSIAEVWSRKGFTENIPLPEIGKITLNILMNQYFRPSPMITSEMKGRIDPTQKITDPYLLKDFVLNKGRHNIVEAQWEGVQMLEVMDVDKVFPLAGVILVDD